MHQFQEMQTQMHRILQSFTYPSTNPSTNDIPPSTTSEDTVDNTDSMLLQVTTLIGSTESTEGPGHERSNGIGTLIDEEKPWTGGSTEYNEKGTMLLEAIRNRDTDSFGSLLDDGETSLQVTDGQDRTPLLLSANLGNVSMVKMLLSHTISAEHNGHPTSVTPPPPDGNHNETNDTNHRKIDLNTKDNSGRTVLHYCAEFGMCDEASTLLDYGINPNALDNGGYPPAYFAVKNRKYHAVELLLAKGATTDFDRSAPTSHEIEELLEKASSNTSSTAAPADGP
ncbi:MAG: hypothetical protein Q9218_005088 [Villophora microphyllina]